MGVLTLYRVTIGIQIVFNNTDNDTSVSPSACLRGQFIRVITEASNGEIRESNEYFSEGENPFLMELSPLPIPVI